MSVELALEIIKDRLEQQIISWPFCEATRVLLAAYESQQAELSRLRDEHDRLNLQLLNAIQAKGEMFLQLSRLREAAAHAISDASAMHLYKVLGDPESYSQYNEGWQDAVDYVAANMPLPAGPEDTDAG